MIETLAQNVVIIFIYPHSDAWTAAKTIVPKIFDSVARETTN